MRETPRSPVRLGLLGCGAIARYAHLRLLPRMPGAALVAAADPDPEARARAQAIAGIPVHGGAEELLAREDIDAVVICAPTHVHAELSRLAARAGKHFFVEKPLAAAVEDARRVLAEAEQAGVEAAVGFNRRFHPLYRRARAILARGTLGPVHTVLTAFCEPSTVEGMPAWKRTRASGGGALLDLASHHLDLVRWFLEDEVVEVAASLSSGATEHDSARLQLSLRRGAEVQGTFSFRSGFADFLEFIGEGGSLRVDRHRPRLELRLARRRGYGTRRAWALSSPDAIAWRWTRFMRRVREPSYRASLAAFVGLLRGGPRGSLATLEDGLRNLEIIAAAEVSAREERRVDLRSLGVPAPAETVA